MERWASDATCCCAVTERSVSRANLNFVIFDLDGTLLRSNELDDAMYVRALADEFGFTDVRTDWSTYPEATDPGILQEVFRERLGRLQR